MTSDHNAEVQARKRNAVDALYREHSQALQRFLTRLRFSRDEVADLVQETYYRMQDQADVESLQHPKAFIFRVAKNLARNIHKHQQIVHRGELVDIENVDIEDENPDPYRMLKSEQELAIVRAAFGELGPKCQAVFVMNRFEGYSYTQIAKILNISASMIEKHISHALSHLKASVAAAKPIPKALRILKWVRLFSATENWNDINGLHGEEAGRRARNMVGNELRDHYLATEGARRNAIVSQHGSCGGVSASAARV